MKVISFDVGIKNMAYCIFDCTNSDCTIAGWDVLNLMDEQPNDHICDCTIIPKSKKLQPKPCTKKARYYKNDKYYCDKHAKSCSQYIVPTKEMSVPSLKKMKVADLIQLGNKYLIFIDIPSTDKMLKKYLLEKIVNYFNKHCFEPVNSKKTKNASQTDLIDIGRNMKIKMNEVENIQEITTVVIENQISPIANRMKTIQGMLAQYFIMTNENADIYFISSANKLKQFEIPKPTILTDENSVNEIHKVNPNYKAHKKDGVHYCLEVLNANPSISSWKSSLDTKKKDDLADAFLQGIWYLRNNNIIICAEDLKIKLV